MVISLRLLNFQNLKNPPYQTNLIHSIIALHDFSLKQNVSRSNHVKFPFPSSFPLQSRYNGLFSIPNSLQQFLISIFALSDYFVFGKRLFFNFFSSTAKEGEPPVAFLTEFFCASHYNFSSFFSLIFYCFLHPHIPSLTKSKQLVCLSL